MSPPSLDSFRLCSQPQKADCPNELPEGEDGRIAEGPLVFEFRREGTISRQATNKFRTAGYLVRATCQRRPHGEHQIGLGVNPGRRNQKLMVATMKSNRTSNTSQKKKIVS